MYNRCDIVRMLQRTELTAGRTYAAAITENWKACLFRTDTGDMGTFEFYVEVYGSESCALQKKIFHDDIWYQWMYGIDVGWIWSA